MPYRAPKNAQNAIVLSRTAVLFALAYFICAEMGCFFSGGNTPFVTFWLPSGLFVATLLLNETRAWPVIVLAGLPANLVFDLSIGTPLPAIFGFYAANALHAVIGAWLVRRFVAHRPTIGTLREFFGLFGFTVILSPMLGALAGAATLTSLGLSSSFLDSWKTWWGSNAIGVLVLAPFILSWASGLNGLRAVLKKPRRQLEAVLLVVGLVVCLWYGVIRTETVLVPQRALVVPFLLWAGMRFGVRGATSANVLMSLLAGFFFNSHVLAISLPGGASKATYVFMMHVVLAMGTSIALIPAIVLDERERMMLRLRESEERYRNLTAAAFEGIAITEKGRLVDGNEQFFKMFGCRHADMIGRELIEWVAPESREMVAEAMRTEREETYSQQLLRRDGTAFHAEARAKMVRVGDRTLRMIALRDVTERKRALEQIMEQAALLNETADAIIVFSLDNWILYWNKGAERMYGWPAADAIGRQISKLLYNGIDPSKPSDVHDILMVKGEWSGVLEHSARDGRRLTVETRLTLVHDKDGNPKSILAINTDITERKKIEAQFLRAQRMESIGNLAGGIAHDLNNILAPIIMSIDILKDFVEDPKALDILETIHGSASRGAAIVQQVLSFARGMDGPQVEIQPKDLIKDIQHIVRDTFPKNIRLETSAPPDVWNMKGDPTQLYQILLNLCVNARDAMPQGGRIMIAIENRVVSGPDAAMHLKANAGPYLAIHVSDTGIGIPKENLDMIFEPFFTTKEFGKGSGLGLSTLLAVVKSHGGFVNVESEPGRGTTFSLFFPAMIVKETAEPHPAGGKLPRGRGELVLVVDDEDSILTIARQTLETFGYRVITATDGIDAMEIYTRQKGDIAVVLTDMMMPFMDGLATIQALRKVNPEVKIIAASGLNANSKASKINEAGVSHFLAKPYTVQAMLETLRDTLDADNEAPVVAQALNSR
ncbi:MAG TPA: PAS domain S-box protein [Chthoniobacteraceae bacterium]|nr:PAS domain S-box protein [Chthoniobacteraceae bacterium]